MLKLNNVCDIRELLENSSKFEIPPGTEYFPEASERCVEVPYVFSNIRDAKRILDIGISLSDPFYFSGLHLLTEMNRELYALDIVPIEKVIQRYAIFDKDIIRKIKFEVGDVRKAPFEDNFFDLVLCVSVLEHIGFDKFIEAEDTVFDRPFSVGGSCLELYSLNEDSKAINEMVRILKPNGRLLVTVPFGDGGVYYSKDSKNRFATYIEYNNKKWADLKQSIRYDVSVSERCFQMLPGSGWHEVSMDISFIPRPSVIDDIDRGVLCAEFTKK